ncbi:MAG TPA: hypothetical protein VMU84_14100, partial [Thermoanaerobaculia bacterium]|nr:hypothetical protein [Thermoanaerobaculia bacterium]
MDRILEIATKVATPLALAGLIIGVLFLLFRQVLAKKIFPKLLRNQSAAVIHKIIDRMFVLALVAILLAVVAYIAGLFAKASQKPGNSSGRDSEPAPTSATLGPYRLTYQLISGVAIDRFLDQNIEPDWSRALTGEIYVVPNAVLEELRRLRASYSAPYGEDAEEVIVRTRGAAERRFNERETKSGLAGVIGNVFVGSTADVNELSFAVPNQNTASLLRDVIVDPRWKTAADGSFLMHSPVPKVYDFAAWKSLDRAELASFASDVDSRASERERTKFRFLLDVTQGGMPPGFAILELFAPECGEGDPFAQTLHVPELALRVAIIEAIGESPLHLGTFVIREGGAQTLRTPTETATLLARSRTRETVLFPVEGLKTSEKLIVPLELFFGDYREPAAGPGDAYWKRRSTELRKLCGERMPSSFTIDLNAG